MTLEPGVYFIYITPGASGPDTLERRQEDVLARVRAFNRWATEHGVEVIRTKDDPGDDENFPWSWLLFEVFETAEWPHPWARPTEVESRDTDESDVVQSPDPEDLDETPVEEAMGLVKVGLLIAGGYLLWNVLQDLRGPTNADG